jgi:hypothetical protein
MFVVVGDGGCSSSNSKRSEQVVPLWFLLTCRSFYKSIVSPTYFNMGLSYYTLGHSPSCFLDPWVSGIYNPRFCIFCMPVQDNDIQYVHCLLFLSPHSRQSCFCVSRVKRIVSKGCMPFNWLTAALIFCWFIFLKLIYSAWQRFDWCLKWLLMTYLPTTEETH